MKLSFIVRRILFIILIPLWVVIKIFSGVLLLPYWVIFGEIIYTNELLLRFDVWYYNLIVTNS